MLIDCQISNPSTTQPNQPKTSTHNTTATNQPILQTQNTLDDDPQCCRSIKREERDLSRLDLRCKERCLRVREGVGNLTKREHVVCERNLNKKYSKYV